MNSEMPSFTCVCAIIQREEVRKKVMNLETKSNMLETRAYVSNHSRTEGMPYKGKRPDLKCNYCDVVRHTQDRCWILHPELKQSSLKDSKGPQKSLNHPSHRANHAAGSSTKGMTNFTANPAILINEFAAYLHKK